MIDAFQHTDLVTEFGLVRSRTGYKGSEDARCLETFPVRCINV